MVHNEILVNKTELEDNIMQLTYNIVHSSGCQCNSDCDCSKSKSTVLRQIKLYTHHSLLNKVNKEKKYKSLHIIKNALSNKNKSQTLK